MPVEDHPIHESVKQNKDAVYGCYNRPNFLASFFSSLSKCWIPFRMSNECRYDRSLKDSKCGGCRRRGSGEAYDKKVRDAVQNTFQTKEKQNGMDESTT